jgi:hypothetical protein
MATVIAIDTATSNILGSLYGLAPDVARSCNRGRHSRKITADLAEEAMLAACEETTLRWLRGEFLSDQEFFDHIAACIDRGTNDPESIAATGAECNRIRAQFASKTPVWDS